MSVPRQQPHAVAKFKHLLSTNAPKKIEVAQLQYKDAWLSMADWDWMFSRRLTLSEQKRRAARAKRKSSK